jgi:methyl-accepting chemotaxis protein
MRMTDSAALTKAIAAHGAWKMRLKAATSKGTDASTQDKVRLDNLCDFAKWLYDADAATIADSHYANIKDLHAQFHETAADVLAMVLAGKRADAEKTMVFGTYALISLKLTTAMVAWNAAVTR